MNSTTQTNSERHAATASRSAASRVQAKLRVSRAQDSYEQEADRAAHAVAGERGPSRASAPAVGTQPISKTGPVAAHRAPTISRLPSRPPMPTLQNQQKQSQESAQPQAEDKRVQTKAESHSHEEKHQEEKNKEKSQKKLQLKQNGTPQAQDGIDHEAQTKADRAGSQRDSKRKDEDRVQRAPNEDQEPQARLQRQESEDGETQAKGDEETDVRGMLQLQEDEEAQARKEPLSSVSHHLAGGPPLATKLFETKGRGEPLPPDTTAEMGAAFHADFSAVRIHTSAAAVDMSRGLRAQAFTHGRDVFFNSGKYEPQTHRGKVLLAHELTHVIQQQAAPQTGAPGRTGGVGNDNSKPEKSLGQQENTGHARSTPPTIASASVLARTSSNEVSSTSPRQRVEDVGTESAKQTGAGSEARSRRTGPVEGSATQGTLGPHAPGKIGTASKPQTAGKSPAEPALVAPANSQAAPELEIGKTRTPVAAAVGEFLRRSTQTVFNQRKAAIHELAQAHSKKHSAQQKLAEAEKAVQPPVLEAQSRANATQVETVTESPAPKPDDQQAKTTLDQALGYAAPKTLEQVDNFKDAGRGQIVGQVVLQAVTAETQEVKSTYRQVENPPHVGELADKPEDVPEVEPTPATSAAAIGEGVVGQVPGEHSDLSGFAQQSDELLAKEQLKEEHLEMVDEGDLAEARQNRQEVKGKVRTGPAEIRQVEREERQKVTQDLSKEEQQGKQVMQLERRQELHGARDHQKKSKTRFELQRQAVTDRVNGIYEKANSAVKQRLDDLEQKSLAAFDQGQKQATAAFENSVKTRMNAFKSKRYGAAGGGFLWAKDKLFGMDDLPEVKEIFESEKLHFVIAVNQLIRQITAESKRVVQECRDIVAGARRDIDKLILGLGPELRKAGAEALKNIRANLDALDDKIKAKEEGLKQKLAAKREAAIKAIEDKIANMKEEMSGLVSNLGRLLLDAMVKFFKWALKKAGYASDQLMGILNKGKDVIQKIVNDPVAFIKNLVKAVRDGIDLFQANIKKHLVGGLMSWLTGAMADVPITLPEKWDLKGILYLILQVLGLTWDRIRTKLVKRLGEKVVRVAETTVDIVKRLIVQGPMGLWEMLKEKAEEIKNQVMEGIRNWAIVELVKQGIIKLVSFLNPAGAIVQAILAIYNTIMFFVENWQRIVEFVKTTFQSVGDIAMGKLSAAAQAVERALAMTIPIILAFLARLLGLSGIGKTITGIIKKIRAPIDKVVNKVVNVVVRMAKKLVGKVKAGAKALKEKGLAILEWWKQRRRFRTKGGATHTLLFRGKGASAHLRIASNERSIERYLTDLKIDAKDPRLPKLNKATELVREIQTITHGKVDPKQAEEIRAKLSLLSTLLIDLDQSSNKELPDPKITPGRARHLSTEKALNGSEPSGSNDEWKFLQTRGITAKTMSDRWVRMHLVSAAVGGPGVPANWVPAPNSINTGPKVLHSFEFSVKDLLKKKAEKQFNVVWVDVAVMKTHSPKPRYSNLSAFPQEVSFKAGLEFRAEGEWKKDSKARVKEEISIPEPPAGNIPSLSNPSHTALSRLNPVFTQATVDRMKQKKPYATKESFIKQMRECDPKNSQWQSKIPDIESAVDELYRDGKIKVR